MNGGKRNLSYSALVFVMSVHEITINARVSLSLFDASDANVNYVAVQFNHSFTQL